MKTLAEIQALSIEDKNRLENEILGLVINNELAKVKDFLKDYPVQISCYELHIKQDEKSKCALFDPYYLILKAAYSCENNDNDFSMLDYLFDEYGLSLKDPKYNFIYDDMQYIEKIIDNYIFLVEKSYIDNKALIYTYISKTNYPNVEIVKYLADRGATFNVHHIGNGWSPLHFWIMQDDYRLLEIAIKGGANVDMQELTISSLEKKRN